MADRRLVDPNFVRETKRHSRDPSSPHQSLPRLFRGLSATIAPSIARRPPPSAPVGWNSCLVHAHWEAPHTCGGAYQWGSQEIYVRSNASSKIYVKGGSALISRRRNFLVLGVNSVHVELG